jgi:hypothetical protein
MAKYGITYWFDSRRLRMWDKYQKHVRRRFKNEVRELGFDWEKFLGDESRNGNGWNRRQWQMFENYLANVGYKKAQAYWDDGEGEDWLELRNERRKNLKSSKIIIPR